MPSAREDAEAAQVRSPATAAAEPLSERARLPARRDAGVVSHPSLVARTGPAFVGSLNDHDDSHTSGTAAPPVAAAAYSATGPHFAAASR